MPPRRRERDLPAGMSRSGTGRCAALGSCSRASSRGSRCCQPRLTEGGGKLSSRGIVARLATQLRVAQLRQRLLFLAALLFAPSGVRPRACTSRGRLVHGVDLTDLGPIGSGCGGGEEACPGQDPRRPRPPPPTNRHRSSRSGPTQAVRSGKLPRARRPPWGTWDPRVMRPGPALEELPGPCGRPCVNREAAGEQRWYEPASVYAELEEDSYGQ